MVECSCYGCENRAIGCHCFCPDYRFYREELEKSKEFEKEKNSQLDAIIKSSKSGTYMKK